MADLPRVPKETCMFDGDAPLGKLTRTWILFFQQLADGGLSGSGADSGSGDDGSVTVDDIPVTY